jgi:hypothetical protein
LLLSASGDAEHLCEQSNDCDQGPNADKTIDHQFDMIHPTLLVVEVDNDAFPTRVRKGFQNSVLLMLDSLSVTWLIRS